MTKKETDWKTIDEQPHNQDLDNLDKVDSEEKEDWKTIDALKHNKQADAMTQPGAKDANWKAIDKLPHNKNVE